MKKGLWCHFDYEGHHIAVHFSIWSGKEVIYVDDHPVSDKRNVLRFTSRHNIEIDGKPLVIELEVENPFIYRVEVRLKKGARTLKRQSKTHPAKWRLQLEAFSHFLSKRSPKMEPQMVQVEPKVVQNWCKSC